MSNVLITGGAGFIGSNLAHDLVEKGNKVTIVDDLSMGRLENLVDIQDKIIFIEHDVSLQRVHGSDEMVHDARQGLL